ncbi:MAG: hypothetical protein ACLGG7_06590 [Bacteriovoracia bacterium]
MEQIKKAKPVKESKGEPTERLTLQKPEQAKLERWLDGLNSKFDGMIRLTKSDLANFLIRHHPAHLDAEEVALIEAEHFDEVRWINWALAKIREAKKQGQSLTLDELMAQRKVQAPPTKKIRRKSAPESAHNETSLNSSPSLDLAHNTSTTEEES